MSSTDTPTPSGDESTYDGPDDDLASGNITDADFVRPDNATKPSSEDQVTRPSPGGDTRSQ